MQRTCVNFPHTTEAAGCDRGSKEEGAGAGAGATWKGAGNASLVTCARRGPKGPPLQGLGYFQKPLLTYMSGKGAASGGMKLSQPIRQSGVSN